MPKQRDSQTTERSELEAAVYMEAADTSEAFIMAGAKERRNRLIEAAIANGNEEGI